MQIIITTPTHTPLATAQYFMYLQSMAPYSFCMCTFVHLLSGTFIFSNVNNNIDNDGIIHKEEDDRIITFSFFNVLSLLF